MTEAEQEQEALHGTFQRLESRWNVLPIPDGDEWHAYDPLPFWHFFAGVRQASRLTEGRRFLDVGCGMGTKLAIMAGLGWEVAGIELRRQYVDAALELVPEADVTHANTLDVKVFNADFVFMYRPARADKLEDELEEHVLGRLAPGTVVFLPLRRTPEVWVV